MPPGTLRLIKAKSNPHGARDTQLYLFQGNATLSEIKKIVPGEGVQWPIPALPYSEVTRRLKILHINDLHGHIGRFSSYGEEPILSRMVSRLREVRQQYRDDPNTTVLAVSAGDDLVGAIFDELVREDSDSYALHTGYRLYSVAGIDVSILGNHDIDLGADVLAHAIRTDAQFPVLSANIVGCRWLNAIEGQEKKPLIFPAALMVTKGIRVGIIGLTSAGEVRLPSNSNMQIINPVRVMHNLLPIIRSHCDVVIVLSHLGYSLESSASSMRDAGDVELARSLPERSVHLIIGGHTHTVINEQGLTANNIVNGIPIVQAGSLGRFLGEVDITLEHCHAAVTNARLTNTTYLPVDEDFEAEHVQPLMDLARPLFKRNLGPVADDPDMSTDAVRNAFAARESALANFITDGMVARCQANKYQVDLALIDASAVRIGLSVGQSLTYGDWFNLMPFADVLRIFWITGWQLKQLLNDNAKRVDLPGEAHTERGFLQFSRGLRYEIQMAEERTDLKAGGIQILGAPIETQLERSFQIACTSFVRQTAGIWQKFAERALGLNMMDIERLAHMDTDLYMRHEMVAYIKEVGGVTAEAGARRDGRVQLVY